MNLLQALEALESGHHVARESWKGTPCRLFQHSVAGQGIFANSGGNEVVYEVLPFIRMLTLENKVMTGWTASREDMCAKDYYVIKL
jgi:hypothetical protein